MGQNRNPDYREPVSVLTAVSGGKETFPAAATEARDAELVTSTCAGDEAAFAILFERHRRRVGVIAGRFFQRREQIEEIVQECFAKAYFALGDFSDHHEGSFAAWLSQIAFNNCYDELRRRRRRETLISELTEEEAQTIEALYSGSGETSIETVAVKRDLAHKLLSRLSPEDRLVLVLLEVEGLSVTEIAKLMNWSAAKVKVRTFRARSSLRRVLKKFL